MYITAIISGLLLLIVTAHLLLLLFAMIDSISTKHVSDMKKQIKRKNIPRIILDRIGQSEEYDDISVDELLDIEEVESSEQFLRVEKTGEKGIEERPNVNKKRPPDSKQKISLDI